MLAIQGSSSYNVSKNEMSWLSFVMFDLAYSKTDEYVWASLLRQGCSAFPAFALSFRRVSMLQKGTMSIGRCKQIVDHKKGSRGVEYL